MTSENASKSTWRCVLDIVSGWHSKIFARTWLTVSLYSAAHKLKTKHSSLVLLIMVLKWIKKKNKCKDLANSYFTIGKDALFSYSGIVNPFRFREVGQAQELFTPTLYAKINLLLMINFPCFYMNI